MAVVVVVVVVVVAGALVLPRVVWVSASVALVSVSAWA